MTALRRNELLVVLFSSVIYLTSLISPPRLMDDVDGAQAQLARNLIQTGDWVTPRLGGIADLEKPIGQYWLIASSYWLFGVHDWAARIPTSLAAILLCWLVARMAGRTIGPDAGLYAGLCLATSVGLWLFTRILIADIALTLSIAIALWGVFRALDSAEAKPTRWALAAWAAIGCGVMLKGLIGAVLPAGASLAWIFSANLWRDRETWRRLRVLPGAGVFLLVTAPWHILAILRNPPYFDFTMHAEAGSYHGFFWFLYFNEHILRFFNRRYPQDYGTVPRLAFWLLHLAWLFPWSVFFFGAHRLRYRENTSASRMRLLALCWAGAVLLFFTASTREEYYSMPAYPALAILIGASIAQMSGKMRRWTLRLLGSIVCAAFLGIVTVLIASAGYSAPGDISEALARNPAAYTLALGHMGDLTLQSFAYLRTPLFLAAAAALTGIVGSFFLRGRAPIFALAGMMILFFQAARIALIAFDPYLGSWPLADALNRAPVGGLIVDDPWFEFSSLLFYTNHPALILNGRRNNLEYGSYAPGAPEIFIGDAEFVDRWKSPQRWYVASEDEHVSRLRNLVGTAALHPVARSGGKTVYVNR